MLFYSKIVRDISSISTDKKVFFHCFSVREHAVFYFTDTSGIRLLNNNGSDLIQRQLFGYFSSKSVTEC